MSGLCLDKVTGKFPVFSLKTVENDIKDHYQKFGKDPEKLPRLPGEVGGETDIMIGIKYLKYFPKEIYKLPNGLTIYEALFENSDGSLGVVAGPHQSFSTDWDCMGQVAYSYDVMPGVTQSQYISENGMEVPLRGSGKNLENPDHDPNPTSTMAAGDPAPCDSPPKKIKKLESAGMEPVSRHKNRKKRPKRKKRRPPECNNIQEVPALTVYANVCNYVGLHPPLKVLSLFCNNFLQNNRGFLCLLISILGYLCIILQKCVGQFKFDHISQKIVNLRVLRCFRVNSRKCADYVLIDPYFQKISDLKVWTYYCENLQKYAGWFKLTHKISKFSKIFKFFQTFSKLPNFSIFFKITDLHKLAQKWSYMQVIFRILLILQTCLFAYFAQSCKKMRDIIKIFLTFQSYQSQHDCTMLNKPTQFCQNKYVPVLTVVYLPWVVTLAVMCS